MDSLDSHGHDLGKRTNRRYIYTHTSLVVQMVKNLSEKQENWVWSLGWEYPLEKGMGTCREPPREIPPMTKVMWKRPDKQRGIRPRGTPWICSSIYPQTKIYLLFIILCFSPTLLSLTGGYPRPPFSGKSQLRALVNKSLGHERNISILTPLLAF